ncbi:MAG TPA: HAD hydrolase family protein [Gemmatimonadales bacterium]
MKFSVLALDSDGTIAEQGRLDPEARSAIAEPQVRGIAVAVVTGRILEDLREVFITSSGERSGRFTATVRCRSVGHGFTEQLGLRHQHP